jgi:hypothetical protein
MTPRRERPIDHPHGISPACLGNASVMLTPKLHNWDSSPQCTRVLRSVLNTRLEIARHFAGKQRVRSISQFRVEYLGLRSWQANHQFRNRNSQISGGANLRPKKSVLRTREFPFVTSRNSLGVEKPLNFLSNGRVATQRPPSAGSEGQAQFRIALSTPCSATSSRALSKEDEALHQVSGVEITR